MKVYQIAYDLRKQRNYEALYERIQSYESWAHVLESSWVIATNQTAVQVHNHLKGAMDLDDGLLVTQMTGEAAWSGIQTEAAAWLKNQLGRLAA